MKTLLESINGKTSSLGLRGAICHAIVATALLLGSSAAWAEELSAAEKSGLAVYKKANCMGCHKWHGQGGGGYGGRARSLRATPLNEDGLTLIVKCGLPGTGMPYHGRKAYASADDTSCFGQATSSLGDKVPSRARRLLSDRQVNSVVHFVLNRLKGRGDPNFEECQQFWGKNKRQCDEFR